GGKFALITLEAFPERINEIFLLAPDGIKTNMWYRLATYPVALRSLFKSMIKKPKRFDAFAHAAFRFGLIDKGLLRFVELQMNTEEKRNRVYHAWVVFRHLTVNPHTIASLINQHAIRLVMIIGKHDKVITAKNMNTFLRHVKNHRLELPDTGHNGVIDASINILKNKL
ncbi:MAG TPA: alpha/beta hydrolase, partial [Cyclobacteriaceae bacterium]|nr:alpha/beta hydrolase [Cyclobacteriaceae bacterium]